MAKKKTTAEKLDAVSVVKIRPFAGFVEALQKMTEEQLRKALEIEANGKQRQTRIDRLKSRLTQIGIDKVRDDVDALEEGMLK